MTSSTKSKSGISVAGCISITGYQDFEHRTSAANKDSQALSESSLNFPVAAPFCHAYPLPAAFFTGKPLQTT